MLLVNVSRRWTAGVMEVGDKVSVDGEIGYVKEKAHVNSHDITVIFSMNDIRILDFARVDVVLDVDLRAVDCFYMRCRDRQGIDYLETSREAYILEGGDVPSWMTLVVDKSSRDSDGSYKDTWTVSCYQTGYSIKRDYVSRELVIFSTLLELKRIASRGDVHEEYNKALKRLAA